MVQTRAETMARAHGKNATRRPMMTVLTTLGRRWSLRILWELRDGPLSFRALRAAADDISPSVLNARLTELRELDVVTREEGGYALTDAGRELGAILMQLARWAERNCGRR